MIMIDGIAFDIDYTEYTRNARTNELYRIEMADAVTRRRVTGVFADFAIVFDKDSMTASDRSRLYEILTSDDEYHTFVLPYNQGTITVEAFVEGVSDGLKAEDTTTGNRTWTGITVTLTARRPIREGDITG